MIKSRREVFFAAVAATILATVVIAVSVALEYPSDEWAEEFSGHFILPATFVFIGSYIVAKKSLEVTSLSEELQRLVRRDRLTETATRDFFFERMESEPESHGVSLMIDIDHFKTVNDTYGHIAGDQVIRSVAETLREFCRKDDIICRFGGEEFVVFLNGATPEQGQEIAERMRRGVEKRDIAFEDQPISVTISIGGSLKEIAKTIDASIRSADAALYKAKETGRNRVVLAWQGISRNLPA